MVDERKSVLRFPFPVSIEIASGVGSETSSRGQGVSAADGHLLDAGGREQAFLAIATAAFQVTAATHGQNCKRVSIIFILFYEVSGGLVARATAFYFYERGFDPWLGGVRSFVTILHRNRPIIHFKRVLRLRLRSDSRSSIQHLKDWNNVGDRTGISILKLLRHIGVDHEVHLQWIPSHVDIYGNEVADDLEKQGTAEPLCSAPSLTFYEIYSIRKNKDLKTWRVPTSHDWYKRSSPGGSIGLACDRADQTALSRFVSGHLRSCSFSHGNKVFPVCAKCGVASASPEHILSCLRLSRETFETNPFPALDFLISTARQRGISNNKRVLMSKNKIKIIKTISK
ncbi:hypothetical protein AVEN_79149-1 [Araneus ventricosus]|uniref:Uncharacterized protein n=1 Tax=Araneus ventricosus TaxID=182803 RepID=A0A4Y2TVR8_ARAVE|nr:hypothetical protein AVEN_79149-1 [Araneus ventricosus]